MTKKHDPAFRWSLNEAAREFGIHRKALERQRRACSVTPGDDHKFSSKQIAQIAFGDLAREKLRCARADADLKEIEVECMRKERIPLDVIAEIYDIALSNVPGILKARLDKVLDAQTLDDMFAEFRGIGEKLREHAARKINTDPETAATRLLVCAA